MSSFTAPLDVSPLNNDMVHWILRKEFTYMIGSIDSNKKVVVPEGFITDFATIPWPISIFIPRIGTYGKATVVHDYLCKHKTIIVDGKPVEISRKEGDKIFLEAMKVAGVKLPLRYVMYAGVRIYAIANGKK